MQVMECSIRDFGRDLCSLELLDAGVCFSATRGVTRLFLQLLSQTFQRDEHAQ